jgi:tetratricopeptide (TPR) repeat protein
MGIVYGKQGRLDEAVQQCRQALALDPDDVLVLGNLGSLLARQDDPKAALECLDKVVDHAPDWAEAHYTRGTVLLRQERYQEAAANFESLVNLQSDFVDDYTTLISCLGHLGRTAEVASAVEKFNDMNTAAGYNMFTVQMQGYWWWYGDIFDYDPAYRDRLVDGLRRAGVQEGAGTDIPFEEYRKLVTKSGGEYDVAGADLLPGMGVC